MKIERISGQMGLEHQSGKWSGGWMEVVFWAGILTAAGAAFRLDGWEFGITAGLLALSFNRLSDSPGRAALFVFYGILAAGLALWIPSAAAAALTGAAAFLIGIITAGSDADRVTTGTDRLHNGLAELTGGLAAGTAAALLLIRSQAWVYLPVQLAAAIFCVLLLIITRNRLLSVALSVGIVLLAALKDAV